MTTVSPGTEANRPASVPCHPEGDGQDDDVPALDGVGEVRRAGPGFQHLGLDGLRAAGVGHLDVVTGRAELGSEVPADGTGTDDSNFHDLSLERLRHP